MPGTRFRSSLTFATLLGMAIFVIQSETPIGRFAFAQDSASKNEPATDPEAMKRLIDRINKLEAEVDHLKKVDPALRPTAEPQVMAMLDVAHLGVFYAPNSQSRFLVLHVMLVNTTKQTFSIPVDNVVAELDGEERLQKDLPTNLLNNSIPSGRQTVQISTMRPPKDKIWKLPAGGMTGIWLVYPGLQPGNTAPKTRLKIKIGELTKEIDVNETQKAQLGLDVQRIGPRQSLALITIGGLLNNFNASALVDELDKLVEQKIARVVIRWGEASPPAEKQLVDWLQTAAAGMNGNANQFQLLPVIPAAIRELHLVEYAPGEDGQARNVSLRTTAQAKVHKTATEAVGSALRSAYLALPRDELLGEIKAGHPLTRAAALAYGGGRLSEEQLPQIFEWAEDKDPEMQKAALQALSHFGEPSAIEKLVLYAKRNIDPLSTSAIESLAGSRFGNAHDAVLELLKNEPVASKRKIVKILAKYPRPVWSDTLYEFVTNSANGSDVDSLRALVQVGHSQIVEVLERSLKSSDKAIRDLAYQELAKRNDERSEKLAVDFSLSLLETGPPDATSIQLLSRTKDIRAIPLLLKQLEASHDHANEINLLLQLGDLTVADGLVQKYASFNNNEKVQVLQGLKLFRHPRFRELCGEALLSSDNQLVTTATTALKQDGHSDSEKLLITAIDKQKATHLLANIMNALAEFGTPSARDALLKARNSTDQTKQRYAKEALNMLYQRSPGFQYVFQGLTLRRDEKDKEALEAYETAVKLDPLLPEAYKGRGSLYLKFERFKEARQDFEKVIELKHEPTEGEFGEFVTSLAIARIGDGQLAEGIKFLEENRNKCLDATLETRIQGTKALFLYNSACAYSRAIEQVDKQTELPDRDATREKYRSQAVSDLAESFKLGFNDYDWASKDPDFKILRDDSDFKKILAGKPANNKDEKPARDDE